MGKKQRKTRLVARAERAEARTDRLLSYLTGKRNLNFAGKWGIWSAIVEKGNNRQTVADDFGVPVATVDRHSKMKKK